MKITFRQIDAFRTVVSTGSVTEAATLLGVSQPAVSRLIADLEAEVGFKLFDRVGRVLAPTEEARLLVDEVRQVVSGMEHIKEAAVAIGQFGHARLGIVATPTFSTQLAPDLIQRFAKVQPRAMTRLEVEANDDAVEWKVSQSFDFGITTSLPANPVFESLALHDDDAYCVLPQGHPLARKPQITPADLAGESFISYMPASQFRFQVDRLFEAEGISRRMQYETRTTDAICMLVARGLGVSVVGASRSYLDTMPGCTALPFASDIRFRATLFWAGNRPLTAVAQSFLDLVRPAG